MQKLWYAGIGSRKTPEGVLLRMEKFAAYAHSKGWGLRSGGAEGADSAFEKGAGNGVREIYLPTGKVITEKGERSLSLDLGIEVAAQFHPNWQNLSLSAQRLMGRNTYQIVGPTGTRASSFVLCWTPDGADGSNERPTTRETGGTGQAIRLAHYLGIKVINMANEGWERQVLAHMRKAEQIVGCKSHPAWASEVLEAVAPGEGTNFSYKELTKGNPNRDPQTSEVVLLKAIMKNWRYELDAKGVVASRYSITGLARFPFMEDVGGHIVYALEAMLPKGESPFEDPSDPPRVKEKEEPQIVTSSVEEEEQPRIRVVNCNVEQPSHYVGRRLGWNWKPSPLANPYKEGESLEEYRQHLWREIKKKSPVYDALMSIVDDYMAGCEITLGCWCHPKPCHGDVILKAVEYFAAQRLKESQPKVQEEPPADSSEPAPSKLEGLRVKPASEQEKARYAKPRTVVIDGSTLKK